MFSRKMKTWITWGCLALLFILLVTSCSNKSENSSTLTPAPSNQVVFRDGFSSNNGNWTMPSDQNGSVFYENGKLHIKNYAASVLPSGSYYIQQQFSDFAVEVEMELVSGSTATWQSLVCRSNGSSDSYMFCISANGKYSILKAIGGVAKLLKKSTSSSHINTGLGVTNKVRVECLGNSLTLYVNGFKVAHVSDNTLTTGNVGFSVDRANEADSEGTFDNVVIWTP